jgi:PmbA/TldA metallopeptidase C-terminal domain
MRIARLSLLLTAAACMAGLHAQDDVVMKAMRDEMSRSMKQLTIENLEKPYFIGYRVVDSENASVAASFGALNRSNSNRFRMINVEVRVGDYKLDNSHFFFFNMNQGTSMQIFNGTTSLTMEDDYKELRRQLWLATDSVYKKAVEDLSKKRATLQNRTRTDDSDDFSKEDPVTTSHELAPAKIDLPKWESQARALSALFRKMPAIHTSAVSFSANNSYARYLTSEGTSYTRREPGLAFNVSATTQAADGAMLDDFLWFHGRSLAEIPSQDELASRIQELGKNLTDLRDAPTLASYSGPVLAEGDAAPQVLRLMFLPSLIGAKQTINGMQGMNNNNTNQAENPFLDRVGARVLPEGLTVIDDPLIAEYRGHHMAAQSKMDEDGMLSREVRLIDNGILKTLLMARDPVRGFEHTTGSRHAGQAAPSNVIVTSSAGLSAADLRAKFIDLIKQRNRPFGIVVRRLRTANSVVLAYKVFPDGHEELVRGLQFVGMNAASFKDIIAVSKEPNFLTVQYRPAQNGQGMMMMTESEENATPVSLVVPSLLFEDATMRQIRVVAPNPPVAGHPFFDK